MSTKESKVKEYRKGVTWPGCYYSSGTVREVVGAKKKNGDDTLLKYQGILKYKDDAGKWRNLNKVIWAKGTSGHKSTDAEKQLIAWQKEAEAEHEAALRAEAEAEERPKDTWTVGEYVTKYVEARTADGVQLSTISFYESIRKKIPASIESTRLCDLTGEQCRKWARAMQADGAAAPASQRKALKFLKAVTKYAWKDGVLSTDPLGAVSVPATVQKRPNALEPPEFARLWAYLELVPDSELKIAASIACLTGMRQGEICGLQWGDYSGHTIHVQRAIGRNGSKTYPKIPKATEKGDKAAADRIVPVCATLAHVLDRWRASRYELCRKLGIEADFDQSYIVGKLAEQTWADPHYIGHGWAATVKLLMLEGTQGAPTFHDLRKTWTTIALTERCDHAAVDAILGHGSGNITDDYYHAKQIDALARVTDAVEAELFRALDELRGAETALKDLAPDERELVELYRSAAPSLRPVVLKAVQGMCE